MTLRDLPRRLARGVLDLAFPPTCALCDQLLSPGIEERFCTECLRDLGPETARACPRCARTVGSFAWADEGCLACRERSFHFHAALRLGTYDGRRRDAVLRMKHASGEDLAEAIGRRWAELLGDVPRRENVHFVIPIPLHWRRRWARGYNQAEALAAAMARTLRLPCRPGWLRRVRDVPPQHLLSPTARRLNVRGVFQARPRPELRGAGVLLVDDVMTTGATLSEGALALRAAGAAFVVAAVLARAES